MSVANCLMITGIVYYSGGRQSYLWVLYLFPIFSALAILDFKQAIGLVFLVFASWSVIYGSPYSWNLEIAFDFGGKSALVLIGTILINSFLRERKKNEDKLQVQREKLNSMQVKLLEEAFIPAGQSGIMEIGQRASKIIHDLGTPITIILGSARMMMSSETPLKQDVQRVIDASVLCKNIISGALNIAKGDDKKVEKIDVIDSIENTTSIIAPLLMNKNITLNKKYKAEPIFVEANKIRLERVFINVITNAKKVVPNAGKITIEVNVKDNFVNITVKDNGPGFAEDILQAGPQMFQTKRYEGQGTGLGLIGSKEAVEKLGGKFTMANNPEGGAIVTVSFPIYSEK